MAFVQGLLSRITPATILALWAIYPAAEAFALDVGECGTMAEMTAKLKAEGQASIATGAGRANESSDPNRPVRSIIFSTNDSGSVGYTLQVNDLLRLNPTHMCVYNRMANVRVYDVRKPGTPPEVLVSATREQAAAKCHGLPIRHCSYHNENLQRGEVWGERVMIQAQHVRKQPDGTYKSDGLVVTITANMTPRNDPLRDGVGAILYTTSEGSTKIDWVFIETSYTKQGESRFASR